VYARTVQRRFIDKEASQPHRQTWQSECNFMLVQIQMTNKAMRRVEREGRNQPQPFGGEPRGSSSRLLFSATRHTVGFLCQFHQCESPYGAAWANIRVCLSARCKPTRHIFVVNDTQLSCNECVVVAKAMTKSRSQSQTNVIKWQWNVSLRKRTLLREQKTGETPSEAHVASTYACRNSHCRLCTATNCTTSRDVD
jgi:hypothetical protein